MQTVKEQQKVFLPIQLASSVAKWKAIDYLRASLFLPFMAIGLSSLHPDARIMTISFIAIGLTTLVTNIAALTEQGQGWFKAGDTARRVHIFTLPLLGLSVVGFLIGSMLSMKIGLALLVIFGFPAFVVISSFGYLAYIHNSKLVYDNMHIKPFQFMMMSSFAYSALFAFILSAIGGVIRLVPLIIETK